MPEKYDVIIIGAGIGGLTAGAILSRNGKKVLVLEKNPMPGGYAVNFRRGEFEFDAAVHLINKFERGDSSSSILEMCGINNKIRLIKPKYLYRTIFPDFNIQIPQCDIAEYMQILTKYFPNEKGGIEELFGLMESIFCRIEDSGERKIRPAEFNNYLDKTYQEMLDEFLNDSKLKAIISQLWVYYGVQINKISGVYFSYSWYDYMFRGGYYPDGGGQAISSALAQVIGENRGKIKLKSKVERILVKDQVAYAVVDTNGNEYFADEIVSNIDAYSTFHDLINKEFLPPEFINEIKRMESTISAFSVYLGLDRNFKNIISEDYAVFINPNYSQTEQFSSFLRNKMHDVPFGITLYSNLPINYIHGDKFVVAIMTLSGYDFWKNLSKEEYQEQKKRSAEVLIKRAEEIIPHLSSYIKLIETATPLTMERYVGSYRGAIYGWNQILSQSGSRRLKNKTPINNLYLVGAWTQPGGGIKGVMQSAIVASNKILNRY